MPQQVVLTGKARVSITTIQPVSADVPTEALKIRDFRPSDGEAWDEFVRAHEAGTFCHLSGWGEVIQRVWKHEPHHLIAETESGIMGVLPLFHVSSRLFGSMMVSSPNAVYGGALGANAEVYRALVEAAKALSDTIGVDYLELRDSSELYHSGDPSLLHKDLYFTFEHELSADEEVLMKSFPRDLRTMIRKGIKNGLVASFGREEYLDEFYDVYATSVRNLGTPVFPKKLFLQFLRQFPEQSNILLVHKDGKVAGGVLSFYFRQTVMPYYGGAYPEFYRAGINNYMYWALMKDAAERGYTLFDFGRSKQGTGAYEFKRGWGMAPRALPYQYYLVRSREMPNLNPTNPKYELMINVWKRLPLSVTKAVGPMIVRNLP